MGEGRVAGSRLAAILAADVAGDSRLTRAYEEGAIVGLRTQRYQLNGPELINNKTAQTFARASRQGDRMRRRQFMAGLFVAGATIKRAQAQQVGRVYRLALVSPSTPVSALKDLLHDLLVRLNELGYVEGRNLEVALYSADGHPDRFAAVAREAVNGKPDAIYATVSDLVLQLKAATKTIPIVGATGDPVGFHIVDSLARPGGNVTGVSIDAGPELESKKLELLIDIVPGASRIGILQPRSGGLSPGEVSLRKAAEQRGVSLLPPRLEAPAGDAEYRQFFADMKEEHADALDVTPYPFNLAHGELIVALARQYRLPALYAYREQILQGGLMAYAFPRTDLYRHAAEQIDMIFKGTNPGDIPIYQARKWNLIINLRTAKALGLTIPLSVLASADEVIE
jgi:putative tryptophan/tyrosine transport system substrate-binding protein